MRRWNKLTIHRKKEPYKFVMLRGTEKRIPIRIWVTVDHGGSLGFEFFLLACPLQLSKISCFFCQTVPTKNDHNWKIVNSLQSEIVIYDLWKFLFTIRFFK